MPPEYLPLAIGITVALVLLLAGVGIFQLVRTSSRKRTLMQKVHGTGSVSDFSPLTDAAQQAAPARGIMDRFKGMLGLLGRSVARDRLDDHTQIRPMFLKAGIRSERAPSVFWGAKVALAVLLPLGFILFMTVAPPLGITTPMSVGIFTGLALLGFYLPNIWLTNTIQKRRQTILEGFPDALDLMVVCVEAGMGLDSAISRVAKESRSNNKTLSEEFHLYNLEIRAGMPRKEALKNLAMRTDLEEMHNLTTLLIQTDKFGTSVSQALKIYSDTLRTQRFQRAEEKAAKVPIKLLFPLILCIFPSLFVAILGPAVISIIEAFSGM